METNGVKSKDETDSEMLRLLHIEATATQLFNIVWHGIVEGRIKDRGPERDAALELRNALNPNWPKDPDWLPEPLASERDRGYPEI